MNITVKSVFRRNLSFFLYNCQKKPMKYKNCTGLILLTAITVSEQNSAASEYTSDTCGVQNVLSHNRIVFNSYCRKLRHLIIVIHLPVITLFRLVFSIGRRSKKLKSCIIGFFHILIEKC